MSKAFLIISALIIAAFVMPQSTVRLKIKSLPAYHPSGSNIYAAGCFNGWNPGDDIHKFQHDRDGNYFLDLKLAKGSYQYKITRGGWDKAECRKDGAPAANFSLNVEGKANLELTIEEWSDRFHGTPKKSTASKNVQIIDTAFLIPQLRRTRRVWIYLPESYYTGTERFPVIYMQDGQNLFDDATSYSGEWGVDEYLDTLGMDAQKSIVVAIDNGGIKRMNEYCPYNFVLSDIATHSRSNKGEGNAYVDFLVKTLKPFIDKKYRTAKDKENTAIAGSSMGALISLFAVLKYPKVFGTAGIFSPSLWLAPRIFEDIRRKGKKVSSKIYFYAGKKEGQKVVSDILRAYEAMLKVSQSKMRAVIRDEGKHNEASWRKEFPLFYEWIFK